MINHSRLFLKQERHSWVSVGAEECREVWDFSSYNANKGGCLAVCTKFAACVHV